ncbi:hypothetical protein [Microvirga sp. TS319]|uniref:hypothetical protein n=1 Tax=Microvirga sp. TS319 TaxID=3241165 RepID=UPI00351A5F3E
MKPQGRRAFSSALLLCLACGGGSDLAAAQELAVPEVTYPSLPKQAASAEGFVPQGWRIEARASGDLDRDGIDDLAFLLRQDDPKNVLENTGLGENPFDTNPRILAVAFRSGPSGDYVLGLENHTLIPRRGDPVQEDPFGEDNGGIAVERGVLAVTLHLFMTAGGWDMFTATHKFQYRNGRFELIGFDRFNTHRASGRTTDISANYLTRKVRTAVGHISRDVPTRATWRTLPRRAPLTLDAIGDGLTFDPGL